MHNLQLIKPISIHAAAETLHSYETGTGWQLYQHSRHLEEHSWISQSNIYLSHRLAGNICDIQHTTMHDFTPINSPVMASPTTIRGLDAALPPGTVRLLNCRVPGLLLTYLVDCTLTSGYKFRSGSYRIVRYYSHASSILGSKRPSGLSVLSQQ